MRLIKGTTNRNCPFCSERIITTKSKQGIDCCDRCKHKHAEAKKCPICKGFLDGKNTSKGFYFICAGGCGIFTAQKLSDFGLLEVTEERERSVRNW
jgi:hypothetical protein